MEKRMESSISKALVVMTAVLMGAGCGKKADEGVVSRIELVPLETADGRFLNLLGRKGSGPAAGLLDKAVNPEVLGPVCADDNPVIAKLALK